VSYNVCRVGKIEIDGLSGKCVYVLVLNIPNMLTYFQRTCALKIHTLRIHTNVHTHTHTHTHTCTQIEAGQYCSFVIYGDGSMKACGKVSMTIHVHACKSYQCSTVYVYKRLEKFLFTLTITTKPYNCRL